MPDQNSTSPIYYIVLRSGSLPDDPPNAFDDISAFSCSYDHFDRADDRSAVSSVVASGGTHRTHSSPPFKPPPIAAFVERL
uniref:Uncharacterized protein n=1 Tax=Globodera rostochiensis TaxID=31243 RepID=A0A914HQ48_GLORO